MTARALLALALTLAPGPAAACAVCLDSASGDRGFTWAFVALMLAPFAVAAALVGVFARWVREREAREDESASPTEGPSC